MEAKPHQVLIHGVHPRFVQAGGHDPRLSGKYKLLTNTSIVVLLTYIPLPILYNRVHITSVGGHLLLKFFHAFQSPGVAISPRHPSTKSLQTSPRVTGWSTVHRDILEVSRSPRVVYGVRTSGGYQTSPTQFPHKWRLPPTSPRRGATTLDQQASIR